MLNLSYCRSHFGRVSTTILLSLSTMSLCHAIEFPSKQFIYKAESRKLPEVLQDFAATLDIPSVVADGVEGTVNGKFNLSPKSFLDLMSSAYGLTWYFDGTVLFIYPSRTNQSRVIYLRDFGVDRIERLLQTLKLGDKRFPLRYDAQEKTLFVSGPPRHIEVVTSVVDALSERGREDGRRIVKVIPLRFASSSDQSVGGTTIKGMATLLNSIYGGALNGDGKGNATPSSSGPTPLTPMQALYGSTNDGKELQAKQADRADKSLNTLGSVFSLNAQANQGADRNTKVASVSNQTPRDEERPLFISDDANNAIVVTGLPNRMPSYVDLIKQLDIASELIELEATIIDVRHDDAATIGIDWSASTKNIGLNYVAPVISATGTGGLFQLTTISADLSRKLMLTLNALQNAGRARVVARPRILGVTNRVATMKDTRTVSVRVAGNLSSNLYSIETGTQIEVIPRKVFVDGVSAIKLSLSIQDGSFDAAVVDAIPIVKKTEISTEAYIVEGEGLLIGGISTNQDGQTQAGIAGLSQIPILGALFGTTDVQSSRRERLFLITPRTVHLARQQKTSDPITGSLPLVEPGSKTTRALAEKALAVLAKDNAKIIRK